MGMDFWEKPQKVLKIHCSTLYKTDCMRYNTLPVSRENVFFPVYVTYYKFCGDSCQFPPRGKNGFTAEGKEG